MAKINLVIFDCDGVLVDSEYVAARVELQHYGKYGLEMSVSEYSERFAGMTGQAIFETLASEYGLNLPETLGHEIEVELDRTLAGEVELIPGADVVLDRLDEARCICSNSSPDRLRAMLTRTGLYDRFRPYIFSARELDPPAPKPAPDIFEKAIAEFGVQPMEALVIEDSVHGVHGAVAAGARVVGFTGGRHSYPLHGEHLMNAGAETVLSRLSDLPATVQAFAAWDGSL